MSTWNYRKKSIYLIDTICDKVFKTDKDVYICPDCQKNRKYFNICIDIS